MPALPMRFPPARLACALAIIATSFLLASCAKVPVVGKKPQISLRVTAAPKANSCGQDVGNSMTFRVLQVTDAGAMTGASLAQLWDREDKLLGAAFISKSEGVVDPGKITELKFERDPKANAVVFVGSFCKPQGSCWFLSHPLSKGSSLKLSVEEFCVRESRK
jgi:type VI secretion system VasD/TssJ family lipoprotein